MSFPVPSKKIKLNVAGSTISKIGDAASDYWEFRKSLLTKEHQAKMEFLTEKRTLMQQYYHNKIQRVQTSYQPYVHQYYPPQ
jgi:hypothetical protein